MSVSIESGDGLQAVDRLPWAHSPVALRRVNCHGVVGRAAPRCQSSFPNLAGKPVSHAQEYGIYSRIMSHRVTLVAFASLIERTSQIED